MTIFFFIRAGILRFRSLARPFGESAGTIPPIFATKRINVANAEAVQLCTQSNDGPQNHILFLPTHYDFDGREPSL